MVLDPGDVVVLAVHPVVRVPVLVDGDRLADVGVAERVDVGPAVEDVGARVRVQGVVAALALDHVVAAPALEVVRTVAAQQGVVPVAGAGELVVVGPPWMPPMSPGRFSFSPATPSLALPSSEATTLF